jgi:hypothetical protein
MEWFLLKAGAKGPSLKVAILAGLNARASTETRRMPPK